MDKCKYCDQDFNENIFCKCDDIDYINQELLERVKDARLLKDLLQAKKMSESELLRTPICRE